MQFGINVLGDWIAPGLVALIALAAFAASASSTLTLEALPSQSPRASQPPGEQREKDP